MDEGLAPAPHRRDCGLAPLSCRLPLKGGVMEWYLVKPFSEHMTTSDNLGIKTWKSYALQGQLPCKSV